jgi:pantetheine-phosphate adenylyltransferase
MKEYRECAIYAGSFDPITLGHLDLIRRAAKIFPRLIVAVAENIEKTPCFTIPRRLEMIREAVSGIPGIEVESFSGLLIDYAARKQVRVVIRGLRAISDFEYEFQMVLTNRKLSPGLETIFLMPGESYTYISSRMVKEIHFLGGDISAFVPPGVAAALRKLNDS